VNENCSDPLGSPGANGQAGQPTLVRVDDHVQVDPQQTFREYVTPGRWGVPFAPPPPATPQPAYLPAGYYQPGYPGLAQPYPPPAMPPGYLAYSPYWAYPGYGYYGWPAMPLRPKRDTYLFVVAILAFIGSCLLLLGGLGSLALLGLESISPTLASLPSSEIFANNMLLLAFALVGIVGGGFCGYHSMRSLFFGKPSKIIWMPRFWIFLLAYIVVLGVGVWLHVQGLDVTSLPFTGLLIYLSGIFPALAVLALGIRCPPFPKNGQWPTTWRRLTLALVSGASLSIGLALILETVFLLILIGTQSGGLLQYLNDPGISNPSPSLYGGVFILLAVVAPIVEELVKSLAVVILIGRLRSKAEAFVLGLACGIGFDLVETMGYISQGYNQWLHVALDRSAAGLLHGFGTAMMALGWYYISHREKGGERRVWLALGCMGYAILQHAIWNGTQGLEILPGPVGDFLSQIVNIGPLPLAVSEIAMIVEAIGILIFFICMAAHLRIKPALQHQGAPDGAVGGVQFAGVGSGLMR